MESGLSAIVGGASYFTQKKLRFCWCGSDWDLSATRAYNEAVSPLTESVVPVSNTTQVPHTSVLLMHLGDHWCAVTVHTRSRNVRFHDSLASSRHSRDSLSSLGIRAVEYVCAMSTARGWMRWPGDGPGGRGVYVWSGEWSVLAYCEAEDMQTNSNDCGVFTLSNVRLAIHDEVLLVSTACRTHQSIIPSLRRSFYSLLLEKGAIPLDGHPIGQPKKNRLARYVVIDISEDQVCGAVQKYNDLVAAHAASKHGGGGGATSNSARAEDVDYEDYAAEAVARFYATAQPTTAKASK